MAIVTELTRTVDVPHEPGQWFTFKMPSWVDLEKARAERKRKALGEMRDTRDAVGKEILDEWRADAQAAQAAAEAKPDGDTTAVVKAPTAEEVLNEYDKMLLLTTGIAAWSYSAPVSVETVSQLDDITATWAGLTLAALTQSGFDAPLPQVVRDADSNVIEVRPTPYDPFPSASSSTVISMERTA